MTMKFLKTENEGLKAEVRTLHSEMNNALTKVAHLEADLNSAKEEIKTLKKRYRNTNLYIRNSSVLPHIKIKFNFLIQLIWVDLSQV